MQTGVACNPNAAFAGAAQHPVNPIESSSLERPILAVKLPDLVLGCRPDFSVGQFGEELDGLWHCLVRRGKADPFIFVLHRCAKLATHPQIPIPSRETTVKRVADLGGRWASWHDLNRLAVIT